MLLSDSYYPFTLNLTVPSADDDYDLPLHWEGFRLSKQNESTTLTLAEIQSVTLPGLKSSTLQLELENPPLDSIDTVASDQVTSAIHVEDQQSTANDDHDIWELVDIPQSSHSRQPASWEKFHNDSHKQLPVSLLSEVNINVYDAILQKSSHNTRSRFISPNVFLRAVANLILGQESPLFRWNQSRAHFEQAHSGYNLSGFTQSCTTDAVRELVEVGDRFKQLKSFAKSPKPCCASAISLASCITAILNTIEEHVVATDIPGASLLSFYQLASCSDEILQPLAAAVGTADLTANQPAFLASVLKFLNDTSLQHPNLSPLIHEICAITAKPAIDNVVAFITSQNDDSAGANTCEDDVRSIGLQGEAALTDLLHYSRLIRQSHHRDLNRCGVDESQTIPSVKFAATWNDVLVLQKEADGFESTCLQSQIANHVTNDTGSVAATQNLLSQQNAKFDPFEINFELHQSCDTGKRVRTNDRLLGLVTDHVQGLDVRPIDFTPVQSIELSIAPLLQAQNRLASYELLKLTFCKLRLLDHLDLLHSHLLFGDSSFVDRLCVALFDTSQVGSTNARRRAGITGLRLEDRDSWPPASSELRLVLMNVLSDSTASNTKDDLRDHLSFAIRELSPTDVDKSKDLHSIHALKFLKLVYNSNDAALDAVISTDCLNKYDRIFQHLLVLVRLHYLTRFLLTTYSSCDSTASRNSDLQRLCIELHHLTTQLLSYSLQVAVPAHWEPLRNSLQRVKSNLESESYYRVMEIAGTFSNIQLRHQATLDNVIDGLLLNEKHRPALERLLEVFHGVLTLHKRLTSSNTGPNPDVGEVLANVSAQVRAFLHVLGLAVKRPSFEGSTTRILFERMTLSGFYVEHSA